MFAPPLLFSHTRLSMQILLLAPRRCNELSASAMQQVSGCASPADAASEEPITNINGRFLQLLSKGANLVADTLVGSIWRWRNQYGEVLGGLGTGIGDGDRGVICGREQECLAGRDCEQEIDCDAEDARDNGSTPWIAPWIAELPSPASGIGTTPAAVNGPPYGGLGTPVSTLIDEFRNEHERTPSPQLGPGYERHEIEGIGGRVKRKLMRVVRVGACVPEWDDEKGTGSRVLGPEVKGCVRSWCGWCWRVIPGRKDIDEESSSVGSGRRESS